MAREKGTGNLQQEKSGRWTIRVGVNGRRLSRSTGTRDRDKAEAFLNRFLAPLGLGATRLPLAEAWHHYEMSPNRRDIAKSTLDSKRNVWMGFARWMEHNHIEIGNLAEVTETAVAEYLAEFRCHHSATTYNNHVCVLREIFRVLAEKAGVVRNPWEGVCLRADDSMSRRELTIDEVERLYVAASKEGSEWKLLMVTGIYTGMRLGDCCRLAWESVNLDRKVIQVIPEKTKKHMHGRPVTIPIHPSLLAELQGMKDERNRHIINRIETPTNPVNLVNDVSKEKEGTGSRERNRPLRGFATRGEANTPSEASAEGTNLTGSAPINRDESQIGFSDRINKIDRIETSTPNNPVNPVNDVSKTKGTGEGASGSLRSGNLMPTARAHFVSARDNPPAGFVNPTIADMYLNRKWQLDEGLRRIFKAANITMSVRIEGRSRKTVVASFHSLRHTFVSLSANAGVPLPVVQSIVGHTSTAMTRHYYHENEAVLRSAVDAIPAIGTASRDHNRPLRGFATHGEVNTPSGAIAEGSGNGERSSFVTASRKAGVGIPARLRRLADLLAKGLVTQEEYDAQRTRILSEL